MLQPGQPIGRYTVEALVGHGGLASVYRVRHVDLGSLHALKLLDVYRPTIRDRLLDEGRAQAALVHPNVVRVTDVLVHEDVPVLVMELVEGPALDRFLLGRPRPDLGTALALAIGITRGLRAAHARGMVHRDLKPGNVLLAPTPGGLLPKLADFGLVKALADDRTLHRPTRVGTAMGTPEFMAPEQMQNAAGVDARADLYSLGSVLYLLLTGSVPISGDDVGLVYERIVASDFPRPLAVVPGLPPALDRLVMQLLAVDPRDRPASCDDVLAVLESEPARVSGGPGTVPPATLQEAATNGTTWSEGSLLDPGRRSWRWLAVPALVLAVLAVVGVAVAERPGPPAVEVAAPAVVPVVVPVPVPVVVDPAPVVPVAAPVAPARRGPKGVRVAATGDATRVWLVRDEVRQDVPGRVPPGDYDVVALFPGTGPVAAGQVTVGPEPVTLRCAAFALRCVP